MERSYDEGEPTLVRRVVSPGINIPTVHSKDAERAELELHTKQFLARGGKIEVVSGFPATPVPKTAEKWRSMPIHASRPEKAEKPVRFPRHEKVGRPPIETMGFVGGEQLLADVTNAFVIIKRTSLAAWCREHNESYGAARQCLLNGRPRSHGLVLRSDLIVASGVKEYCKAKDTGEDKVAALVKMPTEKQTIADLVCSAQPGDALLDLVLRAFRAKGMYFSMWCKHVGMNLVTARNSLLKGDQPSVLARREQILLACGLAAKVEVSVK